MADRLALVGVVGFVGSLFALTLFPASSVFLGLCGVLAIAFLVLFAFSKHKTFLFAGVLFLAMVLGAGRMLFIPLGLSPALQERIGSEITLSGVVVVPPDIRETTQRVTLEVAEEKEKTRILVVAERFPGVMIGDRVNATGTLEYPEPFSTDGGREFRYDLFLKKEGVFAVLSFSHIEVVGQERGFFIDAYRALSNIKPAFINALGAALPEPHSSLASGLIAGGKEGLGNSLVEAFIETGLIHIVVLSGYNILIISDWVRRILRFLPPRLGASVAGMTIVLFVLAAGAGAASVRAGLMALIALIGRATGRTYEAVRALLFVGVLMLLHNPLLLLYDPGFQLSFIATLGLLLGTPLLERVFSFVRIQVLRELAAATLAAQIAVLPLLLYQTGLLSLSAFPANMLVLPAVPLAMGLSFFTSIVGFLVPAIAPVAGLPAFVVLVYITAVAEFFAALPFSSVVLPAFPFVCVLVSYAFLGYVVYRTRRALRAPQPRSN